MPSLSRSRSLRAIGVGLCTALSAVVLAACGSSSSSSSSSPSSGGGGKSGSVDLTAAESLVAPFTGRTGPFPVTHRLVKHPPAGTKYALLQCATPVCALFAQLFTAATKTLGVPLTIVKAGPTVTAQQASMSSIIAQKPAGVIVPGINPDTIQTQLHQLGQMKIPVVSIGVVNAQRFGSNFDTAASPQAAGLVGKLLAAKLILQKQASTNAVFYTTPELTFAPYLQQGFDQEIKALCSACQVRNVNVPLATIGNSAPSLVVSDLQAHPNTNAAAFATEEAATGLPAAFKVAGLNITTTGYAPPPAILQYIKAGQITSGLGSDLPTAVFETVDALARLSTHEPLVDSERGPSRLNEFLGQKDITFNPAMGWTGYPDFPIRFAKLWH